jgi:hypothetical protein
MKLSLSNGIFGKPESALVILGAPKRESTVIVY